MTSRPMAPICRTLGTITWPVIACTLERLEHVPDHGTAAHIQATIQGFGSPLNCGADCGVLTRSVRLVQLGASTELLDVAPVLPTYKCERLVWLPQRCIATSRDCGESSCGSGRGEESEPNLDVRPDGVAECSSPKDADRTAQEST